MNEGRKVDKKERKRVGGKKEMEGNKYGTMDKTDEGKGEKEDIKNWKGERKIRIKTAMGEKKKNRERRAGEKETRIKKGQYKEEEKVGS